MSKRQSIDSCNKVFQLGNNRNRRDIVRHKLLYTYHEDEYISPGVRGDFYCPGCFLIQRTAVRDPYSRNAFLSHASFKFLEHSLSHSLLLLFFFAIKLTQYRPVKLTKSFEIKYVLHAINIRVKLTRTIAYLRPSVSRETLRNFSLNLKIISYNQRIKINLGDRGKKIE